MRQFIRFIIVGGINTVIGYALIFFCMISLGWSAVPSNVAGYMLSLLIAYTLHRFYTFHSRAEKTREFGRFLIAFVIAYTVNLVALQLMITADLVGPIPAQLVAGCIYVITSFSLNKGFAFFKGIDAAR